MDIPLMEEMPAMTSPISFTNWICENSSGAMVGSQLDLQRVANEHVREAWKEAFAQTIVKSMEDKSGASLISMAPLDTTPIAWQFPEQGIRVLDLFGGISIGLAAVLQASIRVHQYLYVEKDELARRASVRHVASLMQRYPDLLPMS